LWYWDLNSGPHACELFAQGWLGTMTILISASWVARITGMSLATSNIFQIGSHLYAQAGVDHDCPIYASHVAGITNSHHEAFYWLRLDLPNCLPRLALNCDSPHFQIPRNWDCRHETLHPVLIFLNNILYGCFPIDGIHTLGAELSSCDRYYDPQKPGTLTVWLFIEKKKYPPPVSSNACGQATNCSCVQEYEWCLQHHVSMEAKEGTMQTHLHRRMKR
jgi:hypothetical protein